MTGFLFCFFGFLGKSSSSDEWCQRHLLEYDLCWWNQTSNTFRCEFLIRNSNSIPISESADRHLLIVSKAQLPQTDTFFDNLVNYRPYVYRVTTVQILHNTSARFPIRTELYNHLHHHSIKEITTVTAESHWSGAWSAMNLKWHKI